MLPTDLQGAGGCTAKRCPAAPALWAQIASEQLIEEAGISSSGKEERLTRA